MSETQEILNVLSDKNASVSNEDFEGNLFIQSFNINFAFSSCVKENFVKSIEISVSSGIHISSQIKKLRKAENLSP